MNMTKTLMAALCAACALGAVAAVPDPTAETVKKMKALKGAEGVAFAKETLKTATDAKLRKACYERISADTRTDFGQWNDGYHARYKAQLPEAELERMKDDYLGAMAELVKLEPDNMGWRLRYGSALMFQGRYKESLAQYESAVKIEKAKPYDKANAYWGLANDLWALKREKEMVARLEECLALKLQVGWFRGAVDYLGYMRGTLRYLRGETLDLNRFPLYTGAKPYPEPQRATYKESFVSLGAKVGVTTEGLKADDPRVKLLRVKLARAGAKVVDGKAPFTVAIRVSDAFAKRPELKAAKNVDQAYSLEITQKGATIEASGLQGALWGVVSFIQSVDFAKKAVREETVLDWPDVAKRGYLGNWWDGCIEYTLFNKMNTVDHQKNPTFDNEFRPLNEFLMGEQAKEFKAFGLELFYGCCWITHADQLPICKERTLPFRVETFKKYAKYGAGVYYPLDDVRFPVLKEDLEKYGSARAIDSKHVTEIYRAVKKDYPDFRLVFCPPFYWGPDGRVRYPENRDAYLKQMGEDLDPEIEYYWTGPRVKSYKFEPYQFNWLQGVTGKRKPYLFQNGIAWHNLLHYTVDHIDWPKIYFDGFLTNGLAAYHLNAHTPNDCPRIASLADALWNIAAYSSERAARRGVQQIMGEKSYDLLTPGNEHHYFFDQWKYGSPNDALYKQDLAELEKKLGVIETCWSNELAYAKANGYPIYGDYGRGVGFAQKIVAAARKRAADAAKKAEAAKKAAEPKPETAKPVEQKKPAAAKKPAKCPDCGGTGEITVIKSRAVTRSTMVGGKRKTWVQEEDLPPVKETCPKCKGKGTP